jgi:hypothetical protein
MARVRESGAERQAPSTRTDRRSRERADGEVFTAVEGAGGHTSVPSKRKSLRTVFP